MNADREDPEGDRDVEGENDAAARLLGNGEENGQEWEECPDSGVQRQGGRCTCRCTKARIVACASYAFCFMVMIMSLLVTPIVVWHFKIRIKAEKQSFVIHQTDTIIVPLNPPSKWLKSASFQTSDECLGELYKIPCNRLQPLHNSSYDSKFGYHNPVEYIYCIDGSSFTWTLKEDITFDVEIWLSTSYDEVNNYDSDENCTTSPLCVVMNNSTNRVVTLKPAEYDRLHGQFYFVHKSRDVSTHLVIDRYYYDTSVYDQEYKSTTINSLTSHISELQGNFDPTHVMSFSDDCFLFNTTFGEGSKHSGNLAVIPALSYDVLFWPGLFGPLLSCVCVLIILAVHKKFCQNCYRPRECLPENVAV